MDKAQEDEILREADSIRQKRNKSKILLNNSIVVADYARSKIPSTLQECFLVLLVDVKNRLIEANVTSIGTLDLCLVYPRDVFRNAIIKNAAKIILVHNHPSGDCNPSVIDQELTTKLQEVGKILDIPILDHIILGEGQFYSFSEHGFEF